MSPEGHETVFLWSAGGLRRTSEERRPALVRARRKTALPAASLDSRRYPRLDLKIPILYRVLGEDVSQVPANVRPALTARSRDVSPIGMCLSLEESLRPGTVLSLTFHLVEERERFEALARVVWSRPAGDSVHTLTGLQFVVVDGRKVKESMHSRMEELIRLMAA
jgi:hypothetical protein